MRRKGGGNSSRRLRQESRHSGRLSPTYFLSCCCIDPTVAVPQSPAAGAGCCQLMKSALPGSSRNSGRGPLAGDPHWPRFWTQWPPQSSPPPHPTLPPHTHRPPLLQHAMCVGVGCGAGCGAGPSSHRAPWMDPKLNRPSDNYGWHDAALWAQQETVTRPAGPHLLCAVWYPPQSVTTPAPHLSLGTTPGSPRLCS